MSSDTRDGNTMIRQLLAVDREQLPADGGELYNRLIFSASPYLLQHAENPVDWYPWGEEAFARALREDKPVFLSIGYATCHWCHVMAHESFADNEVAAFLNRRDAAGQKALLCRYLPVEAAASRNAGAAGCPVPYQRPVANREVTTGAALCGGDGWPARSAGGCR
ncbi:MAG: DUF255 domain-containing protein [Geobacter sp.]|nr:DUF255 domain-containing protein [Geobacter sp.]